MLTASIAVIGLVLLALWTWFMWALGHNQGQAGERLKVVPLMEALDDIVYMRKFLADAPMTDHAQKATKANLLSVVIERVDDPSFRDAHAYYHETGPWTT